MTDAFSFSVPRTARVATRGRAELAREAWFVLHGYGQLAADFVDDFAAVADGRFLAAPEGLSRFYLKDGQGPVGASWMTREAREEEIDDYVRYLDAVYGRLLASVSPSMPVHVLGFSQGAATATRWAVLGFVRVDRLTLWGGGVPPDLDLERHGAKLRAMELTLVVGERDALVSAKRAAAEVERLLAARIPHRVVRFDGGHRLDDETLRRLAGA